MPYHSIGKPGSGALALFRKHGLTPLQKVLSPELLAEIWPGPFHPNAVLIPPVVFWLMAAAALGDGVMCGAVLTFWASLGEVYPTLRLAKITEEAFCAARRKLSLRYFQALFATFVRRQRAAQAGRWLWHGKHLLGFDGTLLKLQAHPALRKAYPPPSNKHGPSKSPQALLVGLVGLCSGLCEHFALVPQKQAEQWCACWLSRYLRPGDLLLADRNFACYEILARVSGREADFLFRLPAKRFHKLARRRTNSQRYDEWLVDLKLPAALRKRCHHLPAILTVRILQYQLPGFQPSWLITSLTDAQAYPYAEVVNLYHVRWNQETMHREWKYTLQLDNLRSLSAQGVHKEVLVQLTLNNALRAVQAEALPCASSPLCLSFLDTKRLVVGQIPNMATSPLETLPAIYRGLLQSIAAQVILVRPGRSYPRKNDGKPRNKGHGQLAQPARLPVSTELPGVSV
jgi:hypothetical protein